MLHHLHNQSFPPCQDACEWTHQHLGERSYLVTQDLLAKFEHNKASMLPSLWNVTLTELYIAMPRMATHYTVYIKSAVCCLTEYLSRSDSLFDGEMAFDHRTPSLLGASRGIVCCCVVAMGWLLSVYSHAFISTIHCTIGWTEISRTTESRDARVTVQTLHAPLLACCRGT